MNMKLGVRTVRRWGYINENRATAGATEPYIGNIRTKTYRQHFWSEKRFDPAENRA